MKKRAVAERVFKCEKCGSKMIAYKKKSHGTSEGHYKTMWCYKCMDRVRFVQQSKWD